MSQKEVYRKKDCGKVLGQMNVSMGIFMPNVKPDAAL